MRQAGRQVVAGPARRRGVIVRVGVQSYSLQTLDDMLAKPGRTAAYQGTIVPKPQERRQTIIPLDAYNAGLSETFNAVLGWTPVLRAGLCDLRDFAFVGEWSLPFHQGNAAVLVDQALGWTAAHIDTLSAAGLHARAGFVGWADGRRDALTLARTDFADLDEAVVLSAPGQHIYGHWLIDYLPRLHILHTSGGTSLPVLLNVAPDWCAAFLRAFGIEHHQLRRLAAGTGVRLGRAIIPTLPKHDAHVAFPLLRAAADAFRRYIRAIPFTPRQPLPRGPRYFLHRGGGSTRARPPLIANMAELRDAAAGLGFTVISPERFSVRAQAHLFQGARVVVGEDGSALHNVAFSEPGCTLGVISESARFSPLHASL